MAFVPELVWKNLDTEYRAAASWQLARYAAGLRADDIPAEALHAAKRSLLDALGCAIGGWIAPGRPICEGVADDLGGPPEATIFGSGKRTGAASATLVNCFLVRFLEYNDLGGGNHNSDSIPSLFAVAERERASGRDFLAAVVLSYEIGARVVQSMPGGPAGWDRAGWSTDARGGLSVPPAVGRLMKLSEEQIAHAIAICAGRGAPLGILDADREENSMAKNLRFGMITRDAILACLMAKRGFTGPLRVVEGDGGFSRGILGGEMDIQKLVDFSGWRILETGYKLICANRTTHGHINATLSIVVEQDLKPADIASVHIRCGAREARHTTALPKKYPRNAETADHGAFYANAFAIKYRNFGPDSANPRHFSDPELIDLIGRITIVHDPNLPDRGHEAISRIVTTDGRTFERRVDKLRGYDGERLTDADLEAKFRDTTKRTIDEARMARIAEAVWTLDRAENLDGLAKLMAFAAA